MTDYDDKFRLVNFFLYPHDVPYNGSYSASMIADFSLEQLEANHNWVQWAFPTLEPSNCVKNSPVLSESELRFLKDDLEKRYKNALDMYWPTVYNFFATSDWIGHPHNYRRITRILTSLGLFGEITKQKAFWILIFDRIGNKLYETKGFYDLTEESPLVKATGFWIEAFMKYPEENNE